MKFIKAISTFMIFISTFLLVACHSEGVFDDNSNQPIPPPSNAKLYQIDVTPESIDIYIPTQYKAIGKYDDGSQSDVTTEVNWTTLTPDIARFDEAGLATPESTGTTFVTASIDGITSDEVTLNVIQSMVCGHQIGYPLNKEAHGGIDDNDQENAIGNCLKIHEILDPDDGRTKWFTSTPNETMLNYLGYTIDNSSHNEGATYSSLAGAFDGSPPENGFAPGGRYAEFRQDGKGAIIENGINGQYDRWCQNLSTLHFAGQSNWHRATFDEMNNLYRFNNNDDIDMYSRFGWPASKSYWTSSRAYQYFDPNSTIWFATRILTHDEEYGLDAPNGIDSGANAVPFYVSCVSEIEVK